MDITERVEDECRLRATEQRFRALIEHSTDVIAVVSADRRISFLNETFELLLGQPGSSWIGRDALDLLWPEDATAAADFFSQVLARPGTVLPARLRVTHADGTPRWLEGTGTNRIDDAAIGGVVINCRDISGSVRAEVSLRQSDERLRQAIEVAQVGIFDHDHRTGEIYWSPRQRQIYGYDPHAPVTFAELAAVVHPDDLARVEGSLRRAHDPAGDGSWAVEHRIVRRDGSIGRVMSRAQTVFDGEGPARRPIRTVGAVIDVTELREADEALRIKDRAIATSLTAIAITDAAARIIYVNPAFVRMWGFESADEILGRPPTEFAEPDAAAALIHHLETHGSAQGELVARRKDGTTFDITLSANAVYDQQGRVANLMASFLDVSESKRLQSQLLQVQKMESLGRLAGGVAHDFNNLLTVNKGYADLARLDIDPRDPLHDHFAQVSAAADSAAALTQQLLAFSRKQIIRPEILDLNDVLLRVERMLGRLLGEDVELRISRSADAGRVRADRGQFEQILINLAVNARDAMPEGGTLTIEVAKAMLDETDVRAHPGLQPGEHVRLAISDTGVGMDQTVKGHLFEPFFTTKGPGRGTGLGLSMVFGAVTQNGGHIEVRSEVGRGTTFVVYLPAVQNQASSSPPPARSGRTAGTETVLLVEDDPGVRRFAAGVLRSAGYQVYDCRTGADALDALDGLGPHLHLLLSDVIMPDMNGRLMAERVAERRPGVRVLFVSGYTEDVIVHHGVLDPGVEFLPKPYSVDSLLTRVREVLDRS
jgi:PAS domain S-box-containing protein